AATAAATEAPAATAAPAAGATLNGVTLPEDAAPPEYQVYTTYFNNEAPYTSMAMMETIYNRSSFNPITDLLDEPLLKLDKNFQVHPAAALSWSSNADGTVWTFNLDPKLMWSDGTPVTADDFVTSFRYAADPKHAWDFAWYYQAPGAIKGWDDALAGKAPTDQIGVVADGPNKLVITSVTPAPFLPAKLAVYSVTMQKAAFEKYGPLYDNDPATSVSCGPFILKEWKKGERIVYEANPKYTGSNKPFIQKVIMIGAKPETYFAGYQADEADFVAGQALQTADNEIIAADPELSKEIHSNSQDFRTDYLFFDDQTPPFNNPKVRQAFSHIVDRDTIIKTIVTPSQGIPAYSFLMPGFPAANSEGLKDIQSYDPAKAKALLAEAGFPGGKGFPKLTLWLRQEPAIRVAVGQAIAATIKQELGIDVEVVNKDQKVYMAALNAKPTQIQFGMVSYGMDFLDPSNMLGVWLSGGRHNWNNTTFDKLVNDAAANLDTTARIAQFQEAEKLLVTEAPAVFIYHRTVGDLIKPWVKGAALEPNSAGSSGLQWPGYGTNSDSISSLYITKDVLKVRTSPPK
ncbi:MAG: peptide ABC transporter substrate-binding protein, partial [Chloroflexales bacterium]